MQTMFYAAQKKLRKAIADAGEGSAAGKSSIVYSKLCSLRLGDTAAPVVTTKITKSRKRKAASDDNDDEEVSTPKKSRTMGSRKKTAASLPSPQSAKDENGLTKGEESGRSIRSDVYTQTNDTR